MPLAGLFEAMQAPGSLGERRGYLRLGAHARLESVLFTLDLHGRCGPAVLAQRCTAYAFPAGSIVMHACQAGRASKVCWTCQNYLTTLVR